MPMHSPRLWWVCSAKSARRNALIIQMPDHKSHIQKCWNLIHLNSSRKISLWNTLWRLRGSIRCRWEGEILPPWGVGFHLRVVSGVFFFFCLYQNGVRYPLVETCEGIRKIRFSLDRQGVMRRSDGKHFSWQLSTAWLFSPLSKNAPFHSVSVRAYDAVFLESVAIPCLWLDKRISNTRVAQNDSNTDFRGFPYRNDLGTFPVRAQLRKQNINIVLRSCLNFKKIKSLLLVAQWRLNNNCKQH